MAWNKLPKDFRPRNVGLDAFDIEAEAQGNATRFFSKNEVQPILGRRIGKINRQLDGRRKTADARATANLVADTAASLHSRLIPEPRRLAVRN